MFRKMLLFTLLLTLALSTGIALPDGTALADDRQQAISYPIVDTNQNYCYDNSGTPIVCPSEGSFAGQDGSYAGLQPAYQNNGDGTITDLNTGLMWQQSPGGKVTWDQAMAGASSLTLGGYSDWRVPTIKELYSLIEFSGVTGNSASNATPYLDTAYFDFEYGNEAAGERHIDAQYWSSTEYVSTTMNGSTTVFGVNFADGRIKGYSPGRNNEHLMFMRYVRGGNGYGLNSFADNGNGTISDQATGLTWLQYDSGQWGAGSYGNGSLNWAEALSWCETLDYAGSTDWRLPNAKELQSIVDYTRSPDTTNSAAIDPLFSVTPILDPDGQPNFPYFWSSTSHLDGRGERAVYVAFGEAQGHMDFGSGLQLMDVHGAGAQRSDAKSGDPANVPVGQGPQGDVQRIYNYARCVRGGTAQATSGGSTDEAPVNVLSGEIPTAGQQAGGQTPPDGGQTPPMGGQQGNGPDLAAAAAKLGISQQALQAALGAPPPDLAAAAATLGITEEALINALGVPPGGPGGQQPSN